MPIAAPVAAAIIGAGGSVAGAALTARAAGKAAKIQAEAAERASQEALAARREIEPQLREAFDKAMAELQAAYEKASGTDQEAYAQAIEELKKLAEKAGYEFAEYETLGRKAAAKLSDYLTDERLLKRFSASDMELDPGYQFRLEEGRKALERALAAKGQVMGGAAAKALSRYAQSYAADEYQRAFDRWRAQQDDAYRRLFGAAQLGGEFVVRGAGDRTSLGSALAQMYLARGKSAADLARWYGTTMAGLHTGKAQSIADLIAGTSQKQQEYLTSGAAARSAGTWAAGQALGSGLSYAGGTLAELLLLGELMKQNRQRSTLGGK